MDAQSGLNDLFPRSFPTKFRYWSGLEKKMFYIKDEEAHEFGFIFNNPDISYMPYVGVLDCEEVPLYIGDILLYYDEDKYHERYVLCDDFGGYFLKSIENSNCCDNLNICFDYGETCQDIRVMGNVYENQPLLIELMKKYRKK